MGNIEKVKELLKTEQCIIEPMKEISFSFIFMGEPKPYSRPRFVRRGKHVGVYNERGEHMDNIRDEFLSQLKEEEKELISEIIKHSETDDYYVELNGKFYIGIPKSDSNEVMLKKAQGIIQPCKCRGDVDNYIKLIMDAMHDVTYNDDKYVTKITAEKIYSFEPRTEIIATIKYKGW